MATLDELPPERDVKDFRYQQLCRFLISERPSPNEEKSPQLIASSSKYGLLFVATDKGLKVIKTSEICRIDKEHAKDKTKTIVKDYPCEASVELPVSPSYLGLSCDSLSLVVAVETPDLAQLYIYDVRSFVSQPNNTNPFLKIRLSCDLADLAWNPEHSAMLVCVMVDGSVQIFETAQNLTVKASLTTMAKATCVCWSPKGKQLVIGQDDGILVQYDQTLTKKKEWTCPVFLQGQQKTVGLIWLSTFSFMVAYLAVDADASDQPNVVLITGGKDVAPKYTSFEDPCFGGGTERQKKYFFNYIPSWEIITATSSTAIEIAVLGKHFDNKNTVERWNCDDSARAEIPLTADRCEAYSMGVAIDYSSQVPIPISEEKSLPPAPILFVLSSDGILIPFYMVYTHPETRPLTTPPSVLSSEGARQPLTSSGIQQTSAGPTSSGLQQTSTGPSSGLQQTLTGLSAGLQQTTRGASPGLQQTPAGPSFQFVQTKPSASPAASPFSFSTKLTGVTTTAVVTETKSEPKPTSVSGLKSDSKVTSLFGTPQSSKSDTSVGGGFGFTASKPDTTSGFGFTAPKSESGSGFGFTAPKSESGSGLSFTAPKSDISTGFSFNASKSDTGSSFSFSAKPAFSPAPSTNTSISLGKTNTNVAPASPANTGTLVKSQEKNSGISSEGQRSSFAVGNTSGMAPSGITGTAPSGITGTAPSGITGTAPSGFTGAISSQGNILPKPTEQAKQVRPQPASFAPKEGEKKPAIVKQKIMEEKQDGDNIDSTFTRSIIEEISHFEEELKKFRKTALAKKVTVGDNREMEVLKRTTEDITRFSDEVKKITQEQNNEVEDKKSLVLDSFSMVEECKMREHRNTDPKYIHLLRAKTLDPANQEKLRNLQQKFQILDRGLRDCDNILDNQWEEYQNKNKKLNRLSTPTTDLIYRSIKSNRNVILHQKLELDDLESQLKQLKMFNKTSTWQDNLSETRNAELSSLADSLLEPKTMPLSSTKLSEPTSPHKMAKLREHLSRRSVPRIKSTRPENLSMSRIVSTERSINRSTAPVHREPPTHNGTVKPAVTTSYNTVKSSMVGSNGLNNMSSLRAMNTTSNSNGMNTMTSLQQQAMNLTGGSIRFSAPVNKLNIYQPSTAFGTGVQSSGTTFGGTDGQSSGTTFGGTGGQSSGTTFGGTGGQSSGSTFGGTSGQSSGTTFGTQLGIKNTKLSYEDITPPSSTQSGYEEDEEDTETNDEDYGFGPGYNMPTQDDGTSESESEHVGTGKNITSTPLSSMRPEVTKTGSIALNRNLFGSTKTASPAFQADVTEFSFGGITAGGPKTSTGLNLTKSAGNESIKSSSTTTVPSSGFKFTSDTTSSFKFGQTDDGATKGFNFSTAVSGKREENASNSSVLSGKTVKKTEQSDTSVFQKIAPSSPAAKITNLPGNSFSDSKLSTEVTKPGLTEGSSSLTSLLSSTSTADKSKPLADFPSFSTKISADTTTKSLFGQPKPTDGIPAFSSATNNSVLPKVPNTTSAQSTTTNVTPVQSASTDITPVHSTATNNTHVQSTATIISSQQSTPDKTSSGQSTMTTMPSGQSTTTTMPSETVQTTTAVSTVQSTTSENAQDSLKQSTTDTSGHSTEANVSTSAKTMNQQGDASENLFLQKPCSISGGLFGQTSTTSGSGGLFGQTTSTTGTTGLFGKTPTTSGSTSLFGQTPSTSASTGLFGQTASTAGQTTSTSGSTGLFGQTPSTAGENTSTSGSTGLFGQTPTTSGSTGLFGQSSSTAGQTTSTSGSTGLFGQTPSTSGSTGLFGQTPTSASTGLFGQTSTTDGQTASTSGSTALFGQTPTTSTGLFGQTPTSAPTGLFGQTSSTSGSTGLFGQTPTTSASTGLFGQTPTSSASTGLFGQTPTTSASTGLFGQTTSASTGLFGQTSSTSGLFGQPSSTSGSTGLFGQTSTTPGSTGLFGQPSSTSGSTGLFGQTSTTPGSTGMFGQTTSTSGSTGLFGQTTGLFGDQSSISGGSPFSQSPGFGQNTTTSTFGQAAFGQTSSSQFGQTTPSSSGATFGGSMFGGLGGQPSTEKANTNVFGTTTFGSSPTQSSQSSIFGNQGTVAFGAKTSNAFGGGSFSGGGGGSVAASGFGVTTQQTTGFGGSPSFGGNPAFGGGATFGSTQPAFGSSSTFGSQSAFGGGGGFGSPQAGQTPGSFTGFGTTGSSPTFEALAGSSNVPTFGSLSQGGAGFGASPGFTGTQSPGFGSTSPPNNPSFTGYRS